ncbi:MAG: DUF2855 family protein [Pseudomonadota bacterium]
MSIEQQQLLVNKQDLSDVRWESSTIEAPGPNEVVLEVEYFALTANNITYAVAGESMNYWHFFPAAEGWGRVPVWGFGRVVASAHEEVPIGNRYYGYFPMGSHLTVHADQVSPRSLVDAAPNRAGLAEVYNQYVTAGPADPDADAAQMLYRPLYMTSFMLADFAEHNAYFGARSVILTSASSKTSLGLAFLLSRLEGIEVVGLTSPGNRGFVEGLGTYDRVVGYDDIGTLDAAVPSMVIDMAGNGEVLAAVHDHFQDALKYSCLVGATHWQARSGAGALAGPKPELFFAPSHIAQRTKDWGPGGLQERFQGAWDAFMAVADNWIEVERLSGTEAVEAAYGKLLRSEVGPSRGLILSVG